VATERRRRLLAALCSFALAALLLAGGSGAASTRSPEVGLLARSFEGRSGAASLSSSALAAIDWRGGPILTSTGETVTVRVSDTYAPEVVTPESWAEFLVGMAHGPEVSLLTTYIAPLDEVQQLCGARALGCYSANRIVALGDPSVDGTTPEEVLRHEYGHHVAFHRLNTPWQAIDWGPKKWASAANVCTRVSRQEAFPGDEGSRYEQNPGEAWAEVYRLMDERRAGITTGSWQIVSPSFYPDDAAIQAAEQDVLQPWTSSRTSVSKRIYGKQTRKVWWIPLRTPLDGDLVITALLPRNGVHEVALVGPNRTSVLKRAQWVGQRLKKLTSTVCGQRSLFVRVTQKGGLGPVKVVATTP
jgi:hypothetical protein